MNHILTTIFLDGTPRAFRFCADVDPSQRDGVDVTEVQKFSGMYILQVCQFTAIWKKAEVGRLPNWTHAIIFSTD